MTPAGIHGGLRLLADWCSPLGTPEAMSLQPKTLILVVSLQVVPHSVRCEIGSVLSMADLGTAGIVHTWDFQKEEVNLDPRC